MRYDVLAAPGLTVAVAAGAAFVGVAGALVIGAGSADAASGPLVIAAGVLAWSGLAKIATPASAAEALHAVGAPSGPALVRLLGGLELALGIAGVLAGGRLVAVALLVAYLGFAAVARRMSGVAGLRSCGCFGSSGARPGVLHVVVDLLAAAAAAVAAVMGSGGLVAIVRDTPAAGVPALAGVALGVAGVVALLTTAAEALDAASGTDAAPRSFRLVDDPR